MNEFYWILVCDTAFVTEGTKNLNIIGEFDSILSQSFPATHPKFSVAACFLNASKTNQRVEMMIKDKAQLLAKTGFDAAPGKNRWISVFANVIFPHEGRYDIELSMSGQVVGSTPITVAKQI